MTPAPDPLNWMQRYAASEIVERADEGRIGRREMLMGLVGVCGSMAAATTFLASCSSGDSSSTDTSTSSPPTDATVEVVPPTTEGDAAVLSVAADDRAVAAFDVDFPGPAGTVFGYFAEPTTGSGTRAGVIVIHEIFGLNDHIRDVTRRVARAGYLALAVDLASRAGGSATAENVPGAVTQGPVEERIADIDAGATFLGTKLDYNGRQAIVGFCFGGAMALSYAAATPDLAASVAYYGPTPQPASVMTSTNAAVLAQYGGTDERVNVGIPELEAAMAGKTFEKRIYDGAGHAFNNDTGAAYDESAAVEAWGVTLEWLAEHLGAPVS